MVQLFRKEPVCYLSATLGLVPRGYGLRCFDHDIECRVSLAMAPYIRKES